MNKPETVARGQMPLLDDWVDGRPDAWDYEAVLQENDARIEWCETIVDGNGNCHKIECDWLKGWNLVWQHGVIFIGNINETIARKAGALFISLWLRGVSASFADKLMNGFIVFLERQEQTVFGVRAVVRDRMCTCQPCLHLALVFEDNEIGGFIAEDKFIREHDLKEGDQVGIRIRKLT